MKEDQIKTSIKESYGQIATGEISGGCCNGEGCCGNSDQNAMVDRYDYIEGYFDKADLALGCGIPTEIAVIEEGHTVVDLGSGAGNDVFIARNLVGPEGKVIGIDMTPEMVIKAWQNNQKLGYQNVEFVLGEIESMTPIEDNVADVVISNCVLNLVPDKEKAYQEIYRILKAGGHFSISDIVYSGQLPDGVLKAAELYAGCIAGASEKGRYLGIIKSAGFKNISIKKERIIELSDETLLQYASRKELDDFRKSGSNIYSITVTADKLEEGSCCDSTESTCCSSDSSESSCCAGNENNGCC